MLVTKTSMGGKIKSIKESFLDGPTAVLRAEQHRCRCRSGRSLRWQSGQGSGLVGANRQHPVKGQDTHGAE